MPIDEEVLERARRFDRAAVEAIFASQYPAVCRMAMGLAGRADVGMGVVRWITKQALNALPTWKDEDSPQRWFLHHTLLTTRRAEKHPPDKSRDTLIADHRTSPPEYVAFIRALRGLPFQQREAFILYHAERLNERWMGVGMDCSVIAAANHLKAANDTLHPISAGQFDQFVAEMTRVYQSLTPPETLMLPKLRRTIARHIWPKRIAGALRWILMLGFLCAAGYAVWRIFPMLEF